MSQLAVPLGALEWNGANLREEGRRFKRELRNLMSTSRGFAALATGEGVETESGNVLGLGFGARQSDDEMNEPTLSVRVYVRCKLPKAALDSKEVIPSEVNGKPTDVIAVGDVRAFARPAQGGASIGHERVTAGTLGCLVRKRNDNQLYILSNNHVLADCNNGAAGDAVIEPGKIDGGTNPIASLDDFVPLKFDESINYIDAAIARVLVESEVRSTIRTIGVLNPDPMPASVFQSVRKSGRTTLHTVGVVKDIAADIRIRYEGQNAMFEDLISIQGLNGSFSDSGDSGSLVVDAVTRRPVALLVGGGTGATFACPIQPVLEHFGVEVVA